MAKIDHAAIRTSSYEDAQKFFEDVEKEHDFNFIKIFSFRPITIRCADAVDN